MKPCMALLEFRGHASEVNSRIRDSHDGKTAMPARGRRNEPYYRIGKQTRQWASI